MDRRYKASPIVEAICEFQFEPDPAWDMAVPGLVYEKLKKTFPVRKQVAQVNAILAESMKPVSFSTIPLMHFLKDDKSVLVQIGHNLLTINHMSPYTSWEEFQLRIHEGLQAYLAVANSDRFRQVALHYINRIEFEHDIRLEDYLNFRPFFGDTLAQDFESFLVGVQLPSNDLNGTTNLRLGTLNTRDQDSIAVMLDINYVLSDPEEIRLDNVFERLDGAHKRVEEVFEACITDKLRQNFGEVMDKWSL